MRLAEIITPKDISWLYVKAADLVTMYTHLETVSDHFTIPADEIYNGTQIVNFTVWLNDKRDLTANDSVAQKYINQLLDWLNS